MGFINQQVTLHKTRGKALKTCSSARAANNIKHRNEVSSKETQCGGRHREVSKIWLSNDEYGTFRISGLYFIKVSRFIHIYFCAHLDETRSCTFWLLFKALLSKLWHWCSKKIEGKSSAVVTDNIVQSTLTVTLNESVIVKIKLQCYQGDNIFICRASHSNNVI